MLHPWIKKIIIPSADEMFCIIMHVVVLKAPFRSINKKIMWWRHKNLIKNFNDKLYTMKKEKKKRENIIVGYGTTISTNFPPSYYNVYQWTIVILTRKIEKLNKMIPWSHATCYYVELVLTMPFVSIFIFPLFPRVNKNYIFFFSLKSAHLIRAGL